MRTITSIIDRLLAAYPTYGEALQAGIVNYSALARILKPQIEAELLEDVTAGAVTMALRRHSEHLLAHYPRERVHPIRNITVRSEIVEVAYISVPELNAVHQKLLKIAERYDQPFLSYGQGVGETTFDMSSVLLPHLRQLTKGRKPIAVYENLATISVRLPTDTVTTTGVYYPFVKALAWSQINVFQIISYFTEVNFVVAEADIEKAFSLLKGLQKKQNTCQLEV
jgi:aspartokinase